MIKQILSHNIISSMTRWTRHTANKNFSRVYNNDNRPMCGIWSILSQLRSMFPSYRNQSIESGVALFCCQLWASFSFPVDIHDLVKVKNGNTWAMYEISSKLTIETLGQGAKYVQRHQNTVNDGILVSLLLTLNRFHTLLWGSHYFTLNK